MTVELDKFVWLKEFSECTNSMLFDGGTVVAEGTYSCCGVVATVQLKVARNAEVMYEGIMYKKPSEFPDELVAVISKGEIDNCSKIDKTKTNYSDFMFGINVHNDCLGYSCSERVGTTLKDYTMQDIEKRAFDFAGIAMALLAEGTTVQEWTNMCTN